MKERRRGKTGRRGRGEEGKRGRGEEGMRGIIEEGDKPEYIPIISQLIMLEFHTVEGTVLPHHDMCLKHSTTNKCINYLKIQISKIEKSRNSKISNFSKT